MTLLKFSSYFILFFAVFFISACDKTQDEDKNASASLSSNESIKFDLKLDNNKSIAIKASNNLLEFDSEQKATMFFFMSTWCTPCLAQLPHLNALQEKYRDGFNVIGVIIDDSANLDINEFRLANKLNFPLAFGDNNFLLTKGVGGINAIPTIILYKSDGSFAKKYIGIIPQEMLDIDIQKAIM